MKFIRKRFALTFFCILFVNSQAWSAEENQPTIALDSAWMTHQWQGHLHDSESTTGLDWSEGSLVVTLALTPPPGFRIIGQPTTRIMMAQDATGVDLRMPHAAAVRATADEVPSLVLQPTTYVQLHLKAPVAPFAGLRELTGTCTLRLARNQPKEALLTPIAEWIDKPANLADDKSTAFTVMRGEDGRLYIEFNSAAAERFSSLRLTSSNGDDLVVETDADAPDQDNQTILRTLPENTPDNATLTLRFVGGGERRTVPFSFIPVTLPAPNAPATTAPTSVPLSEPKPGEPLPIQATDGKF